MARIGLLVGYALFCVLVLGVGVLASAWGGLRPIRPDFLLAGVAAVSYALFIRYLIVASSRQKVQPPGLLGSHAVEISREGVSDTTETAAVKILWTGFTRVCGTPSQIILYVGRRWALIIPRRAFFSPEAADLVLAAMTRWQAAANPKSGP